MPRGVGIAPRFGLFGGAHCNDGSQKKKPMRRGGRAGAPNGGERRVNEKEGKQAPCSWALASFGPSLVTSVLRLPLPAPPHTAACKGGGGGGEEKERNTEEGSKELRLITRHEKEPRWSKPIKSTANGPRLHRSALVLFCTTRSMELVLLDPRRTLATGCEWSAPGSILDTHQAQVSRTTCPHTLQE